MPYTAVTLSRGDHAGMLYDILSFTDRLGPRKVDKPIVLYGGGNLGRLAQDFFDYLGVKVSCVVDTYADRQNTDSYWQHKGVKVLSPQEVSSVTKENSLLLICIATAPLITIRDGLAREGWTDIAFFYDVSQGYADRHPLNNGWFLDELSMADQGNVRRVFSSWEDDTSRAHYLQFLAWRRCRVESLSEEFPVPGDNRFFIPEVVNKFGEREVFVDCGAHTGSVTQTFLKVVGGKYRYIYAIEPDPQNLAKLRGEISGKENLALVEVALGEANQNQPFFGGFDYASKLAPAGNTQVETRMLDSLKIAPTFVKMHLEGGELSALYGAMSTISIHRPILALTVYHDANGVWKTPAFLMDQLVGYRFLFRVHSYAGTGAVIYAIPPER